MTIKARKWDRLLWGIQLTTPRSKPILIGSAWSDAREYSPGEPSRPLLFLSRRSAREWCAKRTASSSAATKDWRYRPVRVREIVRIAGQS